MPPCDVWSVVRVPSPYADRATQQYRPALVIAVLGAGATGEPRVLWVLMITSAGHVGWPGDVPISQLTAAGLPAPSVVRAAKVATIDIRHAERIGLLAEVDRVEVRNSLKAQLADVIA